MTPADIGALMSAATKQLGGQVEFNLILLGEAAAYPHGSGKPQAVKAGVGGWGNSVYGYGGQVFRCESNDGRTRECAANTRAGVQLVRQLSRAACIQGRSWGYGRNGIWVSDGCRAEFRTY